jgi:hypothetical protein
MNSRLIILVTICFLSTILGPGCNNDELPPLNDQILNTSEINTKGCKEQLKTTNVERYIELLAENNNQLRVKFINAQINCAGIETTSASIQNGILKVFFVERSLANCICDFDLECLIGSMENRKYEMEIYTHNEIPITKFSFKYSKKLNTQKKISDN